MRRCFRCNKTQPERSFYRCERNVRGGGRCKTCVRQRSHENRQRKLEHYRTYDIRRRRTALRRKQQAAGNRRYYYLHPERAAAHTWVSNAIRDGRLVRGACRVCGDKDTHAHHPDYSRPQKVVWLCHLHHRHEHGHLLDKETT